MKGFMMQLKKKYDQKIKGFTLIELLAVIIVLAVVALITVPLVTSIIESSKKKAFSNSVYHAMSSIQEELAANDFREFPEAGVSAKDGLTMLDKNPFIGGRFLLDYENGKDLKANMVTDGRYCALGTKNNLQVILGDCYLLDDIPPVIRSLVAGLTTSRSIQLIVDAYDNESDIVSYEYSKDNGKTFSEKTTSNTYTFDNLPHNTAYQMVVRVTNRNHLSSTANGTFRTILIDPPTYTSSPAFNIWSKSKVVTIHYPTKKQNHYIYEYRKNGGAWTETPTGTTQNVTFTANGTLEARVRDGYNTVVATTLTITTIDTIAPSIPTSVIRYDSASGTVRANTTTWTNRTLWWGSFAAADTGGSGIDHYEYSDGCTGNKTGNLATNYTYATSMNATYCIRAVDKAGNTSAWSSKYYFNIDKIAPTCTSSGGSSAWSITDVTIKGVCSNDEGGSGCNTSIAPSKTITTNTDDNISPGDVYDIAGNKTTCPVRPVRIDKNDYTIKFQNCSGITIKTETLKRGQSATPPAFPHEDNHIVNSWGGNYQNVSSSATISAQCTNLNTAVSYGACFNSCGNNWQYSSIVAPNQAYYGNNPLTDFTFATGWKTNIRVHTGDQGWSCTNCKWRTYPSANGVAQTSSFNRSSIQAIQFTFEDQNILKTHKFCCSAYYDGAWHPAEAGSSTANPGLCGTVGQGKNLTGFKFYFKLKSNSC